MRRLYRWFISLASRVTIFELLFVNVVCSAIFAAVVYGHYAEIAFHDPTLRFGAAVSFILEHPVVFIICCVTVSSAIVLVVRRAMNKNRTPS